MWAKRTAPDPRGNAPLARAGGRDDLSIRRPMQPGVHGLLLPEVPSPEVSGRLRETLVTKNL
jgi:hypothetical protein